VLGKGHMARRHGGTATAILSVVTASRGWRGAWRAREGARGAGLGKTGGAEGGFGRRHDAWGGQVADASSEHRHGEKQRGRREGRWW